MKVLHVVPTFYPAVRYGGPIYSVLHLCSQLAQLNCEVKVLTSDADGPRRLSEEEKRDPRLAGLDVQFCRRLSGKVAPSMLTRLPELVRWADVVHLTAIYSFPTFPTLYHTRRLDKPLVWSPRGALQRWAGSRRVREKNVFEFVCKQLLPRRTVLHVTAETEGQESHLRFPTLSCATIPNGINIPKVPDLPQADGKLKLLFIGRLDPKKGVDNLLEALPLLRDRVPEWQLKIVGDGDYGPHLRRKVAETLTPIDRNRVEFCGHLSKQMKFEAFEWCDVVLAPSHTENFGIVVAEALAHARPVIASRGTPWSAVEDVGCGLWRSNEPAEIAASIAELANLNLQKMGVVGRRWMEEAYSWRTQAVRFVELYEAVSQA